MKRMLGPSILILALALGSTPVFAEGPAAPAVAPAPVAPAQPGCAPALDLAAALAGQGELCLAPAPGTTAPELMSRPPFFTRTCVCSCGYPCETDADCDGGSCGPGITCC
jgi:hypothetical protein